MRQDSQIPKPPEGHHWKEVRRDTSVTWLVSWTENMQGQNKYVTLNPSSKLKGEKDWQKYEVARKLAKSIDKIRAEYREDWKSKEMCIRQRAVALYFIDKLALRAGNEKDEDPAVTEEPLTAPSEFQTPTKVKEEIYSEDEIPLSVRLSAVEKDKEKSHSSSSSNSKDRIDKEKHRDEKRPYSSSNEKDKEHKSISSSGSLSNKDKEHKSSSSSSKNKGEK